mmetsp:Transcript_11046/g.30843  ORF Transcript_11046/g.30843 Transcript_11046/m.30843 type:complete len:98 (-) Transcript_11046:2-295(-)
MAEGVMNLEGADFVALRGGISLETFAIKNIVNRSFLTMPGLNCLNGSWRLTAYGFVSWLNINIARAFHLDMQDSCCLPTNSRQAAGTWMMAEAHRKM